MSLGSSEGPVHPGGASAQRTRLTGLIARLKPLAAAALVDPELGCGLAHSFSEAHADEGTVWMLDEEAVGLVPVWNSGAQASRFVLSFVQPLTSGIISMVFATEQPFLENQVHRNQQRDPRLDRRLGVQTMALIVVPLFMGHRCCGVISCVQLVPADQEAGEDRRFDVADLSLIQAAANEFSRRFEERLLSGDSATS
jgi:transcriptional regulator with GAF, ATPase, and Fis domain